MPSLLVTGATGKQGGATINALLAAGGSNKIHALTRNPSSKAAQALASRGVTLVQGNLNEKDSLVQALRNIDAALLVTDFMGPKGVEGEVEQGKLFVDAAKSAGVKHVVFTSVQSADRAPSVPHFDSKAKIEEHLKAATPLSWTILRPVAFMDNIAPSGIARFFGLTFFGGAMGGAKPVQFVAVEDIGKVAAAALTSPDKYHNEVIDLAGDDLTVPQVQQAFQRDTGSWAWRLWLPQFLVRNILPLEFKRMFAFFHQPGYNARISAIRSRFPHMMTFEDYARKGNKAIKSD